ncbi:hypothetical protein ACFFUP_14610 [Vibrio ostreicida]|uniref:hypothetical protein n=1 Tax=Vibrio ostreicida TaxID=526588 RepID=UPI00118149EE|nr:hypothetical protein [Vibrio ostreicida]NPD10440.1 hypothetical protein [Vibrio ostreicida]
MSRTELNPCGLLYLAITCAAFASSLSASEVFISGSLFYAPSENDYIKGEDIGDSYVKITLGDDWHGFRFKSSVLSELYENDIQISELFIEKDTGEYGRFSFGRKNLFSDRVYNSLLYPWLSFPREVYPLNVTRYEGVEWRFPWKNHNFRVVSGKSNNNELGQNTLDLTVPIGMDIKSDWHYLKSRITLAKTTADFTGSGLEAIQSGLVGLDNTVALDDQASYYYNVALEVPIGSFVLSFDTTKIDYGETQYVLFEGYRYRFLAGAKMKPDIFVYYTLGRSHSENDFSALLSQYPATGAQLYGTLQTNQYESHHLGLVKHLSRRVQLKLQGGVATNQYTSDKDTFLLLGVSFSSALIGAN